MRPSRTSLLALTGFLGASVAWAQPAPPPDAEKKTAPEAKPPASPAPADDPSKPLGFRDEVVVTAQKRTEAIAEIPASVTVVPGQLLEPKGTSSK